MDEDVYLQRDKPSLSPEEEEEAEADDERRSSSSVVRSSESPEISRHVETHREVHETDDGLIETTTTTVETTSRRQIVESAEEEEEERDEQHDEWQRETPEHRLKQDDGIEHPQQTSSDGGSDDTVIKPTKSPSSSSKEEMGETHATSGGASGTGVNTNQERESMEEGFVDKDGQAVIAKKMTRVVTTTRTTYDGDTPLVETEREVVETSQRPRAGE